MAGQLASARAQAARDECGPCGAVEAERPVETIAHGKAVGLVERDERGGDGEGEALDQDADLRWLVVGLGNGAETICRVVGNAGGHGENSFGGDRTGGRPAGNTYGGRRAVSAAGNGSAAPGHQGGAVYELMGLASHSTSTSSRASFSKTRQSATSASLS